MRADELQDVAVEGLRLLPVDRVSGLGQHDEPGRRGYGRADLLSRRLTGRICAGSRLQPNTD